MVNDFQAAGSDDEKEGLNTTTAAHGTTEKGESFTYLMKESTKVSCNECDFALWIGNITKSSCYLQLYHTHNSVESACSLFVTIWNPRKQCHLWHFLQRLEVACRISGWVL